MKKCKTMTRIISMLLAIITCFSIMSISASAVDYWRTGNIPSNYKNSGCTTIQLDNTKKNAKIVIHAYHSSLLNGNGTEGNSRLHVTICDTNGKLLWDDDVNTGRKGRVLNLGKDHSAYRIYIREVEVPALEAMGIPGYYTPLYWGIECKKNCHIAVIDPGVLGKMIQNIKRAR